MNEPLETLDPGPTLNITYGWEQGSNETGTLITGFLPTETIDDSVWIFDLTLSDLVEDDGYIRFELIAEDRANNVVTTFRNNEIFLVDNLAPCRFYYWRYKRVWS